MKRVRCVCVFVTNMSNVLPCLCYSTLLMTTEKKGASDETPAVFLSTIGVSMKRTEMFNENPPLAFENDDECEKRKRKAYNAGPCLP